MYNFLLRRTRGPADAEDLAQETFVRAWRRIDSYDPRWQFSTWLFTIGHRLAISHAARERRATPLDRTAEPGRSDDPAAAISRQEQCRQLWEVADRVLTDNQRTALWLRYGEDLPVRDIAAVMAASPVAVRVTLFRAREKLAAASGRVAGAPPGKPQTVVGHLVGERT